MSNVDNNAVETTTTAKDFFLYLAFIVTFIWLVTSFFMGSFALINIWFPDALYSNYWYAESVSSTLSGAIASLVIVTPFFFAISFLLGRDIKAHPQKRDMWVRKWMLYALLFVAFVTVLVDLVLLSSSFFQGEITTRFVSKSLVVLVVSVAVFSYFLYELRQDKNQKNLAPKIAGVGVALSVITLMFLGVVVGGSPAEQRSKRFDNERLQAIDQISWEIASYVRENSTLPGSLSELGYVDRDWTDPLTGEPYVYRVTSEDSFELCADFALATESVGMRSPVYEKGVLIGPESFAHEVGEGCFEYTVRESGAADSQAPLDVDYDSRI